MPLIVNDLDLGQRTPVDLAPAQSVATATSRRGAVDSAIVQALVDGVDEERLGTEMLSAFADDVPLHVALELGTLPNERLPLAQVAFGDYSEQNCPAILTLLDLWAEALFIAPAGRQGWGDRRQAARHRATPTLYLDLAADALDPEDLEAVAANPNASTDALRVVYRRTSSRGYSRAQKYALMELAATPSTPLDILRPLAWHHDPRVRAKVAANPSLTARGLRTLAQDHSPLVRKAATANPHFPATAGTA